MKKPQHSGRKLALSRRIVRRLSGEQLSKIAAGTVVAQATDLPRVSAEECY